MQGTPNRTRKSWRSLSSQLLLLIILPVVIILLIVVICSVSLHKQAMKQMIGERDAKIATLAANAINAQLKHRAATGYNLALRAADGISPEEIVQDADFMLADFDAGISFFTPQGELVASSDGALVWGTIRLQVQAAIDAYSSQDELLPYFSEPITPPDDSAAVVLLIAGTAKETSPLFVGAFSPANIAQDVFAGTFNPEEKAAIMLLDEDCNLIYQAGDPALEAILPELPPAEQKLQSDSQTVYTEMDGEMYVIAFSLVKLTGWHLVLAESQTAAENPLLNTTLLAPLVLIPVVLLAVLALWFGARRIIQPLQKLEIQAKELAWGDFNAVKQPVGGIEEIQHLQQTLHYLSDKIKSAQQSLHSYIGAITMGQEEERRRLARELHDETLQSLIALNQRIQMARMQSDLETDMKLAELQNMAEENIHNLRRLTQALRPLYLEDLGLLPALEMLVREISKTYDIPIQFQVSGRERRLPNEVEVTIFRMAQESLSNIQRHAGATQVEVSLQFQQDVLLLNIRDNGKGFKPPKSPSEFAASGHFGLLGMYERAELIGARLEIDSQPDKGTNITVTVPLQENDSKKSS